MPVGIITGSGTYALGELAEARTATVETPFGPCAVTRGIYAGVEALYVSRHGARHVRLSNHINHRANIWALKELGATAVVGCTACGGVDPSLELGSLVVFDDLHFASNRLPDGSLCTFFTEPGDPQRGHWILHGGPYSPEVRQALIRGAEAAGHPARPTGTYGHVDGPRFNTPTEIAQLAGCGVTAVSQTGGPETVLCGELELPFGLIGFVTDYANEVTPGEPTPASTMLSLMERSRSIFAQVLLETLPRIEAGEPASAGVMARFAGEVTPAPPPDPR
jgi:purine nucleoside phosphorylase